MSKTLIIAEAGVNHNGDISLAKKLIDVAADAGVDYVKFQTFKAESLVTKTASKAEYQIRNDGGENSQFEMIKKLELDLPTHHLLIDYCKEKGVAFLSSAFDENSLDTLISLGLPLIKIPSGEITNKPYLEKVASFNVPIILSTGMCSMDEVKSALEVLQDAGATLDKLTLLHCNTEYPTPMGDVNLSAMNSMAKEFGVEIGYSDHTLGIEIPIAAVAMGAVCIEKHFTLDREMEGPDHRASLTPPELKEMVNAIRNIEIALGDGIKQPSKSEEKNKKIARKSIHAKGDLKIGEVITRENIQMKRPGNGISPMDIDLVLGKKVNVHVEDESMLSYSQLTE